MQKADAPAFAAVVCTPSARARATAELLTKPALPMSPARALLGVQGTLLGVQGTAADEDEVERLRVEQLQARLRHAAEQSAVDDRGRLSHEALLDHLDRKPPADLERSLAARVWVTPACTETGVATEDDPDAGHRCNRSRLPDSAAAGAQQHISGGCGNEVRRVAMVTRNHC